MSFIILTVIGYAIYVLYKQSVFESTVEDWYNDLHWVMSNKDELDITDFKKYVLDQNILYKRFMTPFSFNKRVLDKGKKFNYDLGRSLETNFAK